MNRRERRRPAGKKLYSQSVASRATWQEMVESGELVPSGQMRPDRNGRLQPVDVTPRHHPQIAALLKANPSWSERDAVAYVEAQQNHPLMGRRAASSSSENKAGVEGVEPERSRVGG